MSSKLAIAGVVVLGLGVGFSGGMYLIDGGGFSMPTLGVFGAKKGPQVGIASATTEQLFSYSFATGQPRGVTLIGGGWEPKPSGCTWSNGRGELHISNVSNLSAGALEFVLDADGLISADRPKQTVNVILNGSLVAAWTFSHPNKRGNVRFKVEDALLRARKPLAMAFIESEPVTPKAIGAGDEAVPRSLCLRDMAINFAK